MKKSMVFINKKVDFIVDGECVSKIKIHFGSPPLRWVAFYFHSFFNAILASRIIHLLELLTMENRETYTYGMIKQMSSIHKLNTLKVDKYTSKRNSVAAEWMLESDQHWMSWKKIRKKTNTDRKIRKIKCSRWKI